MDEKARGEGFPQPMPPIQVPLQDGHNAFGGKGECKQRLRKSYFRKLIIKVPKEVNMRYRLLLFKKDGARIVLTFRRAYQAHRYARRTRLFHQTVWYTIERIKDGRVCCEYGWLESIGAWWRFPPFHAGIIRPDVVAAQVRELPGFPPPQGGDRRVKPDPPSQQDQPEQKTPRCPNCGNQRPFTDGRAGDRGFRCSDCGLVWCWFGVPKHLQAYVTEESKPYTLKDRVADMVSAHYGKRYTAEDCIQTADSLEWHDKWRIGVIDGKPLFAMPDDQRAEPHEPGIVHFALREPVEQPEAKPPTEP